MVLVTTTTEARATAFKAALSGLRFKVYDADEIPSTVPNEWVEVGLIRTFGGNDRADGRSAVSSHYLTIGAGGLSVSNVRATLEAARGRLEGKSIEVGDSTTTPLRFYSEDQVQRIDELGRFWQLATYSYAI